MNRHPRWLVGFKCLSFLDYYCRASVLGMWTQCPHAMHATRFERCCLGQRIAISHMCVNGVDLQPQDPVVEGHVVASVKEWLKRDGRGRTGIIVAHRLSTIRSCDRILYIAKTNPDDPDSSAQLAEAGTHQELVDLGGQYAAFARQLASHASENVATTASGFTPAAHAAAGDDDEAGDTDEADAVGDDDDALGGASVEGSPSAVDEQLNAQLQSVMARLKSQAASSTHQFTPAEVEAVANLRRTLEQIESNTSRPRQ